jgi:hypothetical protein
MSDEDKRELDEHGNRTFADRVKKQFGTYVIDRWNGQRTSPYRWNSYSFDIQPCFQGRAALDVYNPQRSGPYFSWRCQSAAYPDLTSLSDDLYVVHHMLRWSMAFTHELDLEGPFFATAGAPAQ